MRIQSDVLHCDDPLRPLCAPHPETCIHTAGESLRRLYCRPNLSSGPGLSCGEAVLAKSENTFGSVSPCCCAFPSAVAVGSCPRMWIFAPQTFGEGGGRHVQTGPQPIPLPRHLPPLRCFMCPRQQHGTPRCRALMPLCGEASSDESGDRWPAPAGGVSIGYRVWVHVFWEGVLPHDRCCRPGRIEHEAWGVKLRVNTLYLKVL